MTVNLDDAANLLREAMRQTVKRHAIWYLAQGALMVVGGVLALLYPLVTSVAVIVLLGWVLIITGVLQGLGMIGARHLPQFWLQLISVVLSIVVGILFLMEPGNGLQVITLLLIVFFMVEGISKVVFALMIRPLPYWGLVFASGIVGIVISVYLLSSFPISAAWLLGLLIAVALVSEGASLAYFAWKLRNA